MANDTYSALKASIKRWARRENSDDFDGEVDTFIEMGENDMFRRLRVHQMESLQTLTTVAGQSELALPARTVEVKHVRIAADSSVNNDRALAYMPLQTLIHTYYDRGSQTPEHYSYEQDNLYLGPTPSAAIDLEALCIIRPQPLSDSVNSNVILTNYSDIYLYSALVHAYAYVRNTEQMSNAASMRNNAITEANRAARKRKASGTPAGIRSVGRRRIP